MLVKSNGIILRSLKYGETSLILDIYSEDYGLNSYIIGGVRNKKSGNKAGSLQLMSMVEFVAYHKDKKALYRIKEVSSLQLYRRIPFDILRSSVGMFLVEILKQTLKESEENQELFHFIFEWFNFLDETPHSVSNIHLLFLLKYAEQIGIQPRDNFSMNNPYFDLQDGQFVNEIPDHFNHLDKQYSELLYDFMMEERDTIHELVCTNAERRVLLEKLIEFYKLHIESVKEIRTHQILNEILA